MLLRVSVATIEATDPQASANGAVPAEATATQSCLPGPADGPVSIELSPAQVDQVVRRAASAGVMSSLFSKLTASQPVFERTPHQFQDRRLSRSLLSGLLLLACFPNDGSWLTNTQAARLTGMNMRTTHSYMATP